MSTFYITTPIFYVNADPHLGHAYTSVLVDVLARYHRLQGSDVFFLTGTDEHGAKVSRAAEAVKREPREFADEHAEQFRKLGELLRISSDDFIRTSDQKRHWPGAEKIWRRIHEAGDIYTSTYTGLYCVGHEAFVTEKDLANGICEDHGKPPERIEEENYFFRLSRYAKEIESRIMNDEVRVIPETRKNEVLSFIREGLQDISFSRPAKDIPWGIPVPGDASQTMYVWCDALSNYISALGYGQNDDARFEKYWPCDVHVIGKDILRFHAVIWPAMLLSAKLPLPKNILVHGLILSGGRKMSKTLGNVIGPFELAEMYGAEAVRFFLLREVPVFEDGDVTKERLRDSYNANLANGLGNLVSRVSAMAERYFGGKIEKPADEVIATVPLKVAVGIPKEGERMKIEMMPAHAYAASVLRPAYEKAFEDYRLNDATTELWRFISMLDTYVQDYEPFKLIKADKERTRAVLWELLVGLEVVAELLVPVMPETAKNIVEILGGEIKGTRTEFTIKRSEALFPRIE